MYSVIVEAEAKADADHLRSTILGTSYLCICKRTSNMYKPQQNLAALMFSMTKLILIQLNVEKFLHLRHHLKILSMRSTQRSMLNWKIC